MTPFARSLIHSLNQSDIRRKQILSPSRVFLSLLFRCFTGCKNTDDDVFLTVDQNGAKSRARISQFGCARLERAEAEATTKKWLGKRKPGIGEKKDKAKIMHQNDQQNMSSEEEAAAVSSGGGHCVESGGGGGSGCDNGTIGITAPTINNSRAPRSLPLIPPWCFCGFCEMRLATIVVNVVNIAMILLGVLVAGIRDSDVFWKAAGNTLA